MRRALSVILSLLLVAGAAYGTPATAAKGDPDFGLHNADPLCDMSARPLADTDGTWGWSYATYMVALEVEHMAAGDDIYRFINSNSRKAAADAMTNNRVEVSTRMNEAASQGMRTAQPAADATFRALKGAGVSTRIARAAGNAVKQYVGRTYSSLFGGC